VIRMQIGQFITGMINGSFDMIQSNNLDNLLCEEHLQFLYDLGKGKNNGEINTYIFESDNAISKTVLSVVYDDYGRKDIINHTIIIKFDNILQDILKYTNLLEKIDKYFTIDSSKPIQKPLPPIVVK